MLQGRGDELDRIDSLLRAARADEGGALLLSGEAGIGKTALLRAAGERADGMRVIEVVGIEAEADLPYAALGELADPLLEGLDSLPSPQRTAIEAALALSPGGADRLAACAALLGLLRVAAEQHPLLVLVDDAQWLDSSSAVCIGYAARRLDDAAVALLASARTEPDSPRPFGGALPELEPSLLGREDALELLRSRADDLAAPAAESLVEAAAGNPLALIELPSLLTEGQRLGREAIDPTPVPRNGLREVFDRRISALEPGARSAALIAALSFDTGVAPVVGACGELGLPPGALEGAERGGMLELAGDRLSFAHPLLRGVLQEGAQPADRRRAHAALAEHASEDARAWHLAAAALGPDDTAAAALEQAAHRATARGAHGWAADALERAAALSSDTGAAGMRTLGAGLAAAMGGFFDRSATLLDPLAGDDGSPLRTPARHLLALVAITGGIRDAGEQQRMLAAEAEHVAETDPIEAASLYADAGLCAVVATDIPLALEVAERSREALPTDAPPTSRCQSLAVLGMALAMAGRTAEATEALDEAGRLLPEVEAMTPETQSISFFLHARISTGQEAILREELRRLGTAAKEARAQGQVPHYLVVSSDAAYRLGDWDAARAESAEAIEIAAHFSQHAPHSTALLISSRVRGARGEAEEARREAERGIELGREGQVAALWGHAALGFLALTRGDIEEAIVRLEEAERRKAAAGLECPLIIPWEPDLAEAYLRAGREDDARRVAGGLAEHASGSPAPLAGALASRLEGMLSEDAFDEAFERALELHDRAGAPFERARTLLVLGGRLHRARRRVEARERLREALAGFEALGATPWVARTKDELVAAGARPREPVTGPDELTAQEVRVAKAVATGATNREVASELFLSPKTIEFHLSRVYRKLGISSRTELAGLVAEGRLDATASREAAAG